MPAVENSRQLVLRDDLVESVSHAVVRKESLHGRMKLEALDAALVDQAPSLTHPHLALVRIDAGKREHDVAVLARRVADFLVWNAFRAQLVFRVDSEHHEPDLAFPIIGNRLRD